MLDLNISIMGTSPITSSPASPRTTPQSTTSTVSNNEVRPNSPISRTSPTSGNDTSPLRPRIAASPTAAGEPTPNPGSPPLYSVSMPSSCSSQSGPSTRSGSSETVEGSRKRPRESTIEPNERPTTSANDVEVSSNSSGGLNIPRPSDSSYQAGPPNTKSGSSDDIEGSRKRPIESNTESNKLQKASANDVKGNSSSSSRAGGADDVGQRSQASFREQYPSEEDWAAKVAQQREINDSRRPRVNIPTALRSSELDNLTQRKQIYFTTMQGRYLKDIPQAKSPQDLMGILGTVGSARANGTGLHELPAHLRAEPLGLLARQTYNAMTNGNRPESDYRLIYRELAAAAKEIPEDLRPADSTKAQNIYQAYFIAPSKASFVETPGDFEEFLGLAGANTQGRTSIQEVHPELRSRSLVRLGLQIHRMQADSDTRAELTKELLAAIAQVPVGDRGPDLDSFERVARSSLSSPNRPTRDPADLVREGVASPEHVAVFYNIDPNTLNAQVASRMSSAGANPN
jgi:hypothetical protein